MPMPADSSAPGADRNPAKDLYRELRVRSCAQLWDEDVPRFNRAAGRDRAAQVGVIRAVGVVFAESGTPGQQAAARDWLRGLLQDPDEKVRRYAVNALPKLGAGAPEERELLGLLGPAATDRERRALGQALARIGGSDTLARLPAVDAGVLSGTEQRIRARLAREAQETTINLSARVSEFAGLRLHLRGRSGLEEIVAGEVGDLIQAGAPFRISRRLSGLVELIPTAPFTLADVFRLRCFDTLGLVLGQVSARNGDELIERLAGLIASAGSRRLLRSLTRGAPRYRLDFIGRGHQRGAVRQLAERTYALCPELLNDPGQAPWTIEIHLTAQGARADLVPRLRPDPRLRYREGDVPAASHPPLAACLAWLGGLGQGETVWDPFCGSGLELVERALLGGVQRLIGSDRSVEALSVARRNFTAAGLPELSPEFIAGDFREVARRPDLGRSSVSLIVTNPPMGMRVQLPDLRGLITELLRVADEVLMPDGRIVFPNPIRLSAEAVPASLKLEYAQTVDMGGFKCRLEMYRRRP